MVVGVPGMCTGFRFELPPPGVANFDLVPVLIERGFSPRRARSLDATIRAALGAGICDAGTSCEERPVYWAVHSSSRQPVAVVCEEHVVSLAADWYVSDRLVWVERPAGRA